MSFEFDVSIICPKDPSATPQRIEQYKDYYRTKYEIAKKCNPNTIIEIGVRAGYSAWSFLKACPNAMYYGFDAENGTHGGRGGPFTWWAKEILKRDGFFFKIFAPFDTQSVGELPELGDFYHIDGDHSEEGVYHDMSICFEDLPKYGHLLIDDYDYEEAATVRVGVDRWLKDFNGQMTWKHIPSLRGEILVEKS